MRPTTRPSSEEAAYEGANLVETLADLGVPYDEAFAYTEGVRRGGALVVVESSDERAERGMAILQRLHPVNIHERTAQWQQEGWTGAAAHARTATTMATATARGTQGRPRTRQRGTRGHGDQDSGGGRRHLRRQTGGRARPRAHLQPGHRAPGGGSGAPARGEGHGRTPAGRSPGHGRRFRRRGGEEVIEMTETAEEPVVTKQARVVEEVVVHKEVTEHTETVRGTERHTEVEVQREPEDATTADEATAPQGFAAYDTTFREHYTTAFATVVRRIRRMSPRTAMATS